MFPELTKTRAAHVIDNLLKAMRDRSWFCNSAIGTSETFLATISICCRDMAEVRLSVETQLTGNGQPMSSP